MSLSLPREVSMPSYLHSGKEPKTDLPQNSQEEKPCSTAAQKPTGYRPPVLTAGQARSAGAGSLREAPLCSLVGEKQSGRPLCPQDHVVLDHPPGISLSCHIHIPSL